MDKQLEEIASIINNYNKRTDIKINGYNASHLPISYEACISSAKSIQLAFKFYSHIVVDTFHLFMSFFYKVLYIFFCVLRHVYRF